MQHTSDHVDKENIDVINIYRMHLLLKVDKFLNDMQYPVVVFLLDDLQQS